MSDLCNLQGLSVLVTRPAAQAGTLCELIEKTHGRPVRFPVMEIAEAEDLVAAKRQLAQLASCDMVIFISVNAVDYAFPLLPDSLSGTLAIAAIGAKTAQRLSHYGLDADIVPNGQYDSESLLKMPALQQLADKKVLIVRGNGGREHLANTLTERGAQIEYVEVYRRLIPKRNPANLIAGWQTLVEAVVVTSNAMLDNLLTLLADDGVKLLAETPLVVVSERIAGYASGLGCKMVWVADNASDEAIVSALCEITME